VVRILIEKTVFNFRSFRFVEKAGACVPPAVDAGPTQTVDYTEGGTNSATLKATVTTYNGATVPASGYKWTQVEPATPKATIASPNAVQTVVSGLQPGEYIFEVEVTDNCPAKATSRVTVIVKGTPPSPPSTVNAGTNQTINLANASSVTLKATPTLAAGVTVTKWEWTQVSPATPKATIASPSAAETVVSGFAKGTYTFEVKITDSKGATATSRVNVVVDDTRSIAQLNAADVNVFPNPFADRLMVSFGDNAEFKKIKISSITGKVVLEENVQNQSVVNLNTSGLAKGHYILTLTSDKEVISRKVVK